MYHSGPAVTEYPLSTRLVLSAAAEAGIATRVLDERAGFLIRLSRGDKACHITPNGFSLNDAVASHLARDKVFTYMLCADAGLRVPVGEYFFTDRYPAYAADKGLSEALAYAAQVGYPLVLKPNRLTQGRHVQLARSAADIERGVAELSADDHAFILQELVGGQEYRVLLLDGRVLFAYTRHGPEMNKNIHRGGRVEDATDELPAELVDASWRAAQAVGLRLAGIDAKVDDRGPVILEVNSKPMMSGYYRQLPEKRERVKDAYRAIVAALFA